MPAGYFTTPDDADAPSISNGDQRRNVALFKTDETPSLTKGKEMKRLTSGTILLAALLTGCGGGGGDTGSNDEASTTVTFSPDSISATFVGNGKASGTPGITVTASISPSISSSVYPYVIDDKGVLVPGAQTVTENDDGTFATHLYFNKSLASGTYTGTLVLKLCKDAACSSVYSIKGGTLPYTLTVTAGI